jgi:glycosyltransferase involved in cell wall biosynthesis
VDSRIGKQQATESYHSFPEKIQVLPYIAPAHIVNYQDKNFEDYFAKLGLPSKFIFYPAQFWPHKNHQVLLEAALLIKNKIPKFSLVFSGHKDHEFKKIYQFCEQNDLLQNLTFLGFVANEILGGFYLRARATVMPTHFGPTNIPPLEAIALKCPVAVSNIYGMPEQLGDAALYFDQNSVTDVAQVMEKLWIDDAVMEKLKINAVKHFENWNRRSFNHRVNEIINEYFQATQATFEKLPS